MTSFYKILIFSCFVVGFGCKSDKADVNTKSVPATDKQTTAEIPGLPQDIMVKLLNECTSLDYIFHNLPFSLSQDEDPSIDQNISFIDINKPLGHIPAGCKPDGRKFLLIKGEIAYDVDVYIKNDCKFYVFVDKKNKPLYANHMTQAGINFYQNIINQAAGAVPQQ